MGHSFRRRPRTLDVKNFRNYLMRKTMKMIDFIKSRGLYEEFLIEKKKTATAVQQSRSAYHKARYRELCKNNLQKSIMSKRCSGIVISEY